MKGGRKSERLREREIEKERIGVDGGGGSQIGWVWRWSGVAWWSMAARTTIGGGDQCVGEPSGALPAVGCQDRSSSMHGWRSERWISDEGGVGWDLGGLMFVGLGCLADAWSRQWAGMIGAWLGWPELGWGVAWSGFCGRARAWALSLSLSLSLFARLCVCKSLLSLRVFGNDLKWK